MSRSPVVVLAVVGALGALFAIATSLLVRREEKRGRAGVEPRAPRVREPRVKAVKEPAVKPVKEPRVKAVKEPRVKAVKEPLVKPAKAERPAPRPQSPAEPTVEPEKVLAEPDPRAPSLVLNLDAFTEFRSGS